jgi:hypothetical protein
MYDQEKEGQGVGYPQALKIVKKEHGRIEKAVDG